MKPDDRDRRALAAAPLEQLGIYLRSLQALGWARMVRATLFVLFGAVVEGFGIVLLVPLVGIVFGQGDMPRVVREAMRWAGLRAHDAQLVALLVAFACVAILRGVILWRRDVEMIELALLLVDRWRTQLIRALTRASLATVTAMRRSNIEYAMTAEVGQLAAGSDRLLRGGAALLQLVAQLGLAIWLSPALSVAAIVLLGLAAAMLLPMLRAAHRHGAELSADGSRRHATLSDFIAGVKLAKAYDVEDRYARDYIDRSDALRRRGIAYVDRQQKLGNAYQVAAVLAATALLAIGVLVTHTPGPILSAVLVLIARVTGPAMSLVQGAQAMATMLPAVAALSDIERALLAGGSAAAPPRPVAAPMPARPADIVLRQLRYGHDPQGAQVLRGADGAIRSGEFVVLVGPSGIGKTTLADIVIGLVEPDRGDLIVDGQAVAAGDARAAWRRQTGYVPQDPFLFDDTIEANLRWVAPDAEEAALWRALEAAEAADFVRAAANGLQTRVGERGGRLSGGERQRICLARALLREPRLLVLDEATSALDPATERRLFATLARLRGTLSILMITHRLPSEARPDRIYALGDGVLTVVQPAQADP